jgi:hypothetical protein
LKPARGMVKDAKLIEYRVAVLVLAQSVAESSHAGFALRCENHIGGLIILEYSELITIVNSLEEKLY